MEVNLIVVGGKRPGQAIPVPGSKFVIGRKDDCQLRPQSERVSRHHCAILVEDGVVTVRDFKSKNGTFVNGQRVQGDHELKAGDHLQVGPLEFEVQLIVNVSGKKKPKVHNITEAAERVVQTGTGEDLDVSNWLDDEDDEAEAEEATLAGQHTSDTLTLPATPNAGAAAEKVPAAEKPDDDAKKKPQSLFERFQPEKKVTSGSSREAAADMLKQFFHRKP